MVRLVLLEPKEIGEILDRMALSVLLVAMVMLDLKDVLVPLVTKDQLDLLERREILDLLALLEVQVFKELVVDKVNLALKDYPDPKDLLDLLVPLVKREEEASVESLVNQDNLEKLEALD